ncbi:hypothetical protein ACO2Q8_17435 [Larkinella sp. VNQ87]|uniref:hypothetical protein n=1 Tax=Larkinella sp. VNQ87 TaxID=3400921 RepID=UPI003C0BE5DC
MVKLGLICEGESESYIFDTDSFKAFLATLHIELIGIAETGSKNQYLGDRLIRYRQILLDQGAEKIIALIDLDRDACITVTKQNVLPFDNQMVVVAVKEFENWYLADTEALSRLLGNQVHIDYPENDFEPFKTIAHLNRKGFGGSKPRLAMKMRANGFSVERAAQHPNCPSANYFLTKLQSLRP